MSINTKEKERLKRDREKEREEKRKNGGRDIVAKKYNIKVGKGGRLQQSVYYFCHFDSAFFVLCLKCHNCDLNSSTVHNFRQNQDIV